MRRWVLAVAVGVIPVLVLVIVLTGFGRNSGSGGAIGSGVAVTGTNLPNGLKATTTSVAPAPGMDRLSATVDLQPSGPLSSPATVTVSLTSAAPAGDAIVVATTDSTSGTWTYLAGHLSPDRKTVTFTTDHFSLFAALGVDIGQAVNAFKTAFLDGLDGGATTTVAKPTCSGEDTARAGGFSVASTTTDTLYWCFGMAGTNRVLTVVNHRRYPLEMVHPDLSVAQGGTIDWAQLSSLSHLLSGQVTIIAPGDQVTFTVNVPVPGKGGIQTQMDGVGQSLYALQTGVDSLISILTRFGAGSGSKSIDTLSKLLGIPSCADALTKSIGDIISGCFSPADLVKAFGTSGLILAPIVAAGSLVAFFHSEWNALVDEFNAHDKYVMAISRTAPITPVLRVSEFGVEMVLPPGIANATYTIDPSGAYTGADVNGTPYTVTGSVTLSTPAYAQACAAQGAPGAGPARVDIYSTDPRGLQPFDSSGDLSTPIHLGKFWYVFAPDGQFSCGPDLETLITLFRQAFATLHISSR